MKVHRVCIQCIGCVKEEVWWWGRWDSHRGVKSRKFAGRKWKMELFVYGWYIESNRLTFLSCCLAVCLGWHQIWDVSYLQWYCSITPGSGGLPYSITCQPDTDYTLLQYKNIWASNRKNKSVFTSSHHLEFESYQFLSSVVDP